MPGRAERPGLEQMPQVAHRRGEPVSEGRHVHDLGVPGRLVHLADLARAQAQRLLAHDVLAGPRGRHGDRPVGVVRRGDHHGVNLVGAAQGLGIGRRVLDVPFGLALLEQAGIRVADRDQPGAGVEPEARQVMIGRHGPDADERDPDRL